MIKNAWEKKKKKIKKPSFARFFLLFFVVHWQKLFNLWKFQVFDSKKHQECNNEKLNKIWKNLSS